jgi:ABC-type transporter Mla subunit MlaD
MSNEEFEKRFEKKIEFILDQQAQFASDIQQLRETQATNDNHLARLAAITTDGFKELIEKVSSVIDAQIRTEENVSSLASSLTDKISVLTERMNELAEAQAHTDQRLNVIIDIISEDRNGRSRS